MNTTHSWKKGMEFISSLRRRWLRGTVHRVRPQSSVFLSSRLDCVSPWRMHHCTTRFPNAHQKPDVCLCSFWFFSAANNYENTEHTHTRWSDRFLSDTRSHVGCRSQRRWPLIDALAFKFYSFSMCCLAVRCTQIRYGGFLCVPRRGCRCQWAILMIIWGADAIFTFAHIHSFFRALFDFLPTRNIIRAPCNAHSYLYNIINLILIVIHLNTRVQFD